MGGGDTPDEGAPTGINSIFDMGLVGKIVVSSVMGLVVGGLVVYENGAVDIVPALISAVVVAALTLIGFYLIQCAASGIGLVPCLLVQLGKDIGDVVVKGFGAFVDGMTHTKLGSETVDFLSKVGDGSPALGAAKLGIDVTVWSNPVTAPIGAGAAIACAIRCPKEYERKCAKQKDIWHDIKGCIGKVADFTGNAKCSVTGC